jgi:hypothetical protein
VDESDAAAERRRLGIKDNGDGPKINTRGT